MLRLLWVLKQHEHFSEAGNGVWVSKDGRPGHNNSSDTAPPHHLVVDVELEFFVVNALLNFVETNYVLDTETGRRLVINQLLEDLAAVGLAGLTNRTQLLHKEHAVFDLETHHARVSTLRLRLSVELDIHSSFEAVGDRVLYEFNRLHCAKNFANRANHVLRVSLGEVVNLQPRVELEVVAVSVENLSLSKGLHNQVGRSVFVAQSTGDAALTEVGVSAKQLVGRRNDS